MAPYKIILDNFGLWVILGFKESLFVMRKVTKNLMKVNNSLSCYWWYYYTPDNGLIAF